MKYIFLFLISLNCFSENWVPHSKVLEGSVSAYQLEAECRRNSGEKCYDLGDKPSTVFSEYDKEVDDESKPIYSKSEIELCATEEECKKIELDKKCQEGFFIVRDIDKEVYCSALIGYQKKIIKEIKLDESKLLAYDAAQAIKQRKKEQKPLRKRQLLKDIYKKISSALTEKEIRLLLNEETEEDLGVE